MKPQSTPKLSQPRVASYIELNAQNILHNINEYRKFLGAQTKLGCVLKGNAYGHGFAQTLPLFHPHVDVIFVIDPLDAFAVRAYESAKEISPRRVVVLGGLGSSEVVACAQQDIEVAVGDESFAAHLPHLTNNLPRLKIHIHVDTGLGREGFLPGDLEKSLEFLKEPLQKKVLQVVGFMTHFSNVEDVTEQEYAQTQLEIFEADYQTCMHVLNLNTQPHSTVVERHTAQSASSFILPASFYDVARVGIGLYGLWPSAPTRLSARVFHAKNAPELRPALSWRTPSQQVKIVPAGSFIGYGCTYRTERETRLALLPVGYFDGYPRALSGRGYVLVHGKRCPILGRVMMNHTIIDVTQAATTNDPLVATLVGDDESEHISIEQLADWAGTINYEIVTRIGAHLERRVQNNADVIWL